MIYEEWVTQTNTSDIQIPISKAVQGNGIG